MQLEFSFCQPWIDKQREIDEAWQKFWAKMSERFRAGPSWREIFAAQPMISKMDEKDDDSLVFPLDVLVGEYNQPQFEFVKPLYQEAWRDLPVVFAWEEKEFDRVPSCV